MTQSTDPTLHRHREQQFLEHVQRLLSDDRLRLDTSTGSRAVTTLIREVKRDDRAMELKRVMSDLKVYDREVQNRMPLGEVVEITLSQKRFFVFRQTVGRMRVVCVSPTEALLKGEAPRPLSTAAVQKILSGLPPSLGGVPQTVVLMSTGGFTREAHALADRNAGRAVLLVEPSEAGGWSVAVPSELSHLAALFDPEGDEEKRARARTEIDRAKLDLLTGGVSADRLAARARLPQPMVEAEMKAYAKATPGMVAKRLDGRFVLFREGAGLTSGTSALVGGASMPLIDRMKALFGVKGDEEKKVAFLSERRAALSQQRALAYEEIGTLEAQEADFRQQFKDAPGATKKKLITSQLLQLHKDLERRQQLLGMLNQQISVVSTHLHNLELVQQGQTANLPDTDEMTSDAVKAEEVLAELEASAELAGSVATHAGAGGLTSEEQSLYEELEAEAKGEKDQADKAAAEAKAGPAPADRTGKSTETARDRPAAATPPPLRNDARRREPEAG